MFKIAALKDAQFNQKKTGRKAFIKRIINYEVFKGNITC